MKTFMSEADIEREATLRYRYDSDSWRAFIEGARLSKEEWYNKLLNNLELIRDGKINLSEYIGQVRHRANQKH